MSNFKIHLYKRLSRDDNNNNNNIKPKSTMKISSKDTVREIQVRCNTAVISILSRAEK